MPKRPGVVTLDEETQEYTMVLRATQRGKSLVLILSEPEEGEECTIALEPISEYALPFTTEKPHCVSEDYPRLTKASLPCRHGFSALALLYHFAKNSMTCPCCRAGHAKARLAEHSIPRHLRQAFVRHLLQAQHEETREQIAADAALAASVMEIEVRQRRHLLSSTRVVFLLMAYESMDNSSEPILALELPLSSSLTGATLVFASFGYFLHQLNLNLRFLPIRPAAFEIAVGVHGVLGGPAPLFRTVRFPMEGPGRRLVFSNSVSPGQHAVHIETSIGPEGQPAFASMYWAVSLAHFTQALISAAVAGAEDTDVEV